MRKYLALLIACASTLVFAAGTIDRANAPWERPESSPLRSNYDPSVIGSEQYERLVDSNDVEANDADGTDATVGNCFKAIASSGTEWAACGGGIAASSGNADPSGGVADDLYFQVDGSDVLQSVWRNIAGTWTEFTVPSGSGGGTGASITSGTADPSGGAAGDAYIQVDASNVVQSIWRNISGTWTEFTIPAGGSGLSLSNATPQTVIGSGGTPGSTGNASDAGHQHHLADGAVTQSKISDGAVSRSKTAASLALTETQATDKTNVVVGLATGERIGQSIDENSPVEELRGDDLGDADDYDSYTIKTDQGDVFVVHPTQVGHSITFTEYELLDDVAALWGFNTEHRWRGIHNQHLVLRNRQDDDVFITSSGSFFRTDGAVFRHLAHPDNWKGQWPTEAEAENHIDALSQTVQYENVLAQATAYTAGTVTKDWVGYGDDVQQTVAGLPVYNDGQVIGNLFDEDNPLKSCPGTSHICHES